MFSIAYRKDVENDLGESAQYSAKSLILSGGQRRDRTADAGLFRAALYH
jgi:hypothetical protein